MSAYVWWAVRGTTLDAMCERLERAQLVADPHWGVRLDKCRYACFTHGEWTFVLVRDRDARFDTMLDAFPEVVRLERDETNEWSELVVKGAHPWSVYGGSDDDAPRASDGVPAELAELLEESDVGTIPVQIATRLTGVDLDDAEPERVVRFSMQPEPVGLESEEEPWEVSYRDVEMDGERATASVTPSRIIDPVCCAPEALLVKLDKHVFRVERERFPPALTPVDPTPCDAAAPTPWGTVLAVLEDDDLNSVVREGKGWVRLPFSGVDALRPVRDGVVVLPATSSEGDATPHVIRNRDGRRVVERIDLPRVSDEDEDAGVAGFADGSFLLSWQGTTYHVRDGVPHATKLVQLRADPDAATLLDDGSLLVASYDDLARIWPDGRAQVISGFTEPFKVVRGPDDTIVVVNRDEETAFAIWRPADDRVARVAFDDLGMTEDPSVLYTAGDRLVVIAGSMYAFPLRALSLRWLPRG